MEYKFIELTKPSLYLSKQDALLLESFLQEQNEAYRLEKEKTKSGFPTISDQLYDELTFKLEEINPDSDFLKKIEEEPIFGEIYEHKKPMLSTQKAFTTEKREAFLNRCLEYAKEIGIKEDILFKVTPKLDGMAGKFEDGNFATRGDGLYGTKINHLIPKITIIGNSNNDVGEIIIPISYFDKKLSDQFEHPRNVGNGVVTSEKNEKDNHRTQIFKDKALHFVSYKELPNYIGTKEEILEKYYEIISNLESKTDYCVDGFVVEVVNEDLKKYMSNTNKFHRWMCAFKEKGEKVSQTVTDVTYQVGRTGNVTPVIHIKPTLISGAMVSRCTAHNAKIVLDKKIGEGAMIEFIRSGEVIPKIESVIKPANGVVLPEKCPSCDSPLKMGETFLTCENKMGCSAQSEGRILHFFSKLPKCNGFGPKIVEKLVENGLENVYDIFSHTKEDFINAGITEGVASNLSESLIETKKHKIKDWKLLSAFGIRHLGEGNCKRILDNRNIEDIFELTIREIENIENFGPISSSIIFDELERNKKDILNVFNNSGLNIVQDEVIQDSPFSGKKILFTGTMFYNGEKINREELEQEVLSMGAKKGSISKNLNILVVGEKSGSKLDKAKKLNEEGADIQILTIKEYMETK